MLSRFYGEAAARVCGAEAADCQQRTASSAIPPDAAPIASGLLVCVRTRVDGAGEAQVGEFVEGFVAEKRLADDVGAVIGRRLWIDKRGGLQEAALREVLSIRDRGGKQRKEEFHCSRRSAMIVKSSSFRGRLYSSFSMRSTVRPLRRKSVISWVRAVQIP